MQEEKKEILEGVMSDDELDAVGGGRNDIDVVSTNEFDVVNTNSYGLPETCACNDGMGSPNRPIDPKNITIQDQPHYDVW